VSPPYLVAGLSRVFRWEAGSLIIVGDTELHFDDQGHASAGNLGLLSYDFRLGGEFNLRDVVLLRMGSDSGQFSIGIGIKMGKLALDYTDYSHQELGQTHRFSVSLQI
jgi:hypothetical protein